MEETQKHSDTTAKEEQEVTCPSSPSTGFEIPSICDDYKENIPSYKREEIEASRITKQREANDIYEAAKQTADDARAEAESKYSLAEAKYNSAKKVLSTKVKNAKEELWPVYRKCIRDSSPKNCMDDIPQDKKAICIAFLERDLSVQDIEFQTGMQTLEQTKSEADAEWEEAQKAYDSAICLAKAEKEKAYKDADVEWRKNLSQALEEIC